MSNYNNPLIQPTKIQPAATQVKVYQGATPANVAVPPQDSNLSQLGHALESLNPTLNQAARFYKAKQDEFDQAGGIAASEKMQKQNIKDIDEAVRRDLLPAGASPVFLQALRENQLAYAADKQRQSLSEAYWSDENADLRASNDKGRFDAFVAKHSAQFDHDMLTDEHGQPLYTALDFHKSQYGAKTREAVSHVYGQHLQYRVSENEKAAEEVAGLRTTKAITEGLDTGLDHSTIAANVNSIYRDPNTGLVVHGLKASKQTELTVDAVVDSAIERRDVKVLDMLESMPTSNGSYLAGTGYAKKKVEAARLHITNEVYLAGERSRLAAERRGAGIASDPEAEARAAETRDRHEAEYALKVKETSRKGSSLDREAQAEPEQAAIIQHLANGSSAFDEEVVGHMKNLAKIDPAAAQQMMQFVQGQQHKQKTASDEQTTLRTFSRLRADLSNDPSKFDRGRIIQEANHGNLTAGQVSSLYNEAEQSAAAHKEHPVLQSDFIKTMRTDIRAASMKSALDEFGEGRLRADAATNEFNDLVLDFVKTHPEAGAYEISKAMRPEVERLARAHNSELDSSLESQAQAKKTADQVQKAKAQTEQIKAQDQAQEQERVNLRKQLAPKYKNAKQLEEIIDGLLKQKKG